MRLEVPAFGLGRPSARWLLSVALAIVGASFGVAGYLQQRLHGDVVTGLRTVGQGGVAWGIYIVCDIFFVGLAFGGITFATVVRLFHLDRLRSLIRIAKVMTLVSLSLAGMCVLADLGRPLHGLMNFPRYARTMSPFFGTFSLVVCTGSLATFVYLWLGGRADAAECAAGGGRLRLVHRLWAFGWRGTEAERWRHRQSSFWMSLTLLPLLVVAYSTLGFVFGIQGGRPGWFGALQAPGFLVLAAISATGMLVVLAALARRIYRLGDGIEERVFYWMGNALWVLALVALYIVAVEELTASYASSEAQTRVASSIERGVYAPWFWTMVAGLSLPALLLFLQFLRRRVSIALTVACALMLNVATLLKRFLIVVPSQTHGMLLPYDPGGYRPTWVEFSVPVGLLSLGTLAFLVFAKLFPLVPLSHDASRRPPREGRERGLRRMLRIVAAYATLLTGAGIATIGYLLCARVGNDSWQDPPVPLSPLIFVAGFALVFYSAAVYEVFPSDRSSSGGA